MLKKLSLTPASRFTSVVTCAALGLSFISGGAFAAGFEKNILFSGKYAGRGGAAASDARGAEALFFNPAGISTGRVGLEATGDLDPTWGHFSGPLTTNSVNVTGNATYDTLYGAFASFNPTEHLGIAVGSYTGAGAHAEFDGSSFGPLTNDVKARIYDTEESIGAGYEIIPGLRVGAAWRITHVSASLNSFGSTPAAVISPALTGLPNVNSAVQFNNMGAWRYNGFRVGAQYTAPDNSWGLGVSWRSRVDFNTSGNVTGSFVNPLTGASTAFGGGPATLGASLPSQISAGANYEFIPKTLRVFFEYVWTEYDVDKQLNVGGAFALPAALGGTAVGVPNIPLGFNNDTNLRFGLEYTGMPGWTYRAGYVWTSQVTPNTQAQPILEAPAHGDTITIGAGTMVMGDLVELDGALEYDWVDGYGTGPGVTPYGSYPSGEFTSKGYGAHLGATVRF